MLFDGHGNTGTAAKRRVQATFELIYTLVDFGAAATFLIGSILFLYDSWQGVATWFFIVGSGMFALKPTLRLTKELKLAAMGDEKDLAERESL
ncbi:YrhK family protein [Jannaschia rubra]|uniref:YrhK domain-containing protein n=1 Tax=Jannaschia rubra TaxID=282197 RepID=A0A0M6XKX8_9RHOB|nr:YrhK family protein [Jannaschia rubra]CTQ31578.1 hypothetical protein JAN5088_00336 [Jannaschia rubra]SFF76935.1 YrhK-like protein [Jannaschia rubra]